MIKKSLKGFAYDSFNIEKYNIYQIISQVNQTKSNKKNNAE